MKKGRGTYVRYFLKNAPGALKIRFFHKQKNIEKFRGQKGITLEYSSKVLEEYIKAGKPFAAVRFGASELGCMNATEKIDLGFKKTYKDKVRWAMKVRAGYYPTGDGHLSEYSHFLEEKIKNADILAISGIHMEDYFQMKYAPNAKIIQNWALEPLLGNWTPLLKGKKVLVITAFADEVMSQYQRREKLFPGHPEILPEMDLKVLEAPQTMGHSKDARFPSFMRSLEEIEERMRTTDFDILLVGAGAYGTLLALYAKQLGKMALQSGGATQTLFGIIGKRWENREHVKKWINEYWIRPYKKPEGYKEIDGGAYW